MEVRRPRSRLDSADIGGAPGILITFQHFNLTRVERYNMRDVTPLRRIGPLILGCLLAAFGSPAIAPVRWTDDGSAIQIAPGVLSEFELESVEHRLCENEQPQQCKASFTVDSSLDGPGVRLIYRDRPIHFSGYEVFYVTVLVRSGGDAEIPYSFSVDRYWLNGQLLDPETYDAQVNPRHQHLDASGAWGEYIIPEGEVMVDRDVSGGVE